MSDTLKLIFSRLLENTQVNHYRFLYYQFSLADRLTGLTGPRGVGKTTLLLQIIKNHFVDKSKVFYFSADHIYFDKVSLYEFIEQMYLDEGVETFFIDEIHQYKKWSQELKNLYDGFPSIRIVFSGSSSLDLIKGSYDLSRRAKMYHLEGMSFREYLNFTNNTDIQAIKFEELITNPKQFDGLLASIPKLKCHFNNYLRQGYYPFYNENPLSYYEKLLEVIDKTIYEDIANFYNLKTANLHHFKKILNFLVSIPPGLVTTHNLAKNLSIDDKTVSSYITSLHETGLIKLIYAAEVGNQGLRKADKIFINNTNLQFAIEGNVNTAVDIGTIRELFFIQAFSQSDKAVYHSKIGDYMVDDYVFEIGGKNKTMKQITGLENAFLIKDDILTSGRREIPLMLFGFIY